jgi:hypothetical protein
MACLVPRSAILRKPDVSILQNIIGSTSKNLAGSVREELDASVRKSLTGAAVLKKILIVVACSVALGCASAAVAQVHPGGHVGGGGRAGGGGVRTGAPPVPVHAPIAQPRVFMGPRVGPHIAGLGPRFPFGPRPNPIFRHRFFFGPRFFAFPVNSPFLSLWWPSCGPGLGWGWGVECYSQPSYGYGFGNYVVTVPTYESPVYWYGGEEPLVWLYLKNGTVYPVSDYWFVNGQVHFAMVEDDPRKPVEHVVSSEQLDVDKTVFVNSRRGFRVVVRDEPWPQYLKDHPDSIPPDLAAPQKN